MKMPNGYGSIYRLSGKRRNPFIVRKTDKWVIDAQTGKAKQTYITIGYYPTRQDAMEALAEFNKNPYDVKNDNVTFAELYEMWSSSYFQKLSGTSSWRTISAAYAYCSGLYNMRIKDIRSYHLKECMENGTVMGRTGADKGKLKTASPETKSRMKSMFNLMFDYAFERDMVNKNYARAFQVDKAIIEEKTINKKERIPFSDNEIAILWDNLHQNAYIDIILIGIYSGWRPQELATLKVKNIDLAAGTMQGGLKTKAGKNRIVPIHPVIKPLIENRIENAVALNSEYLFNDAISSKYDINMSYDKYNKRFKKVMSELNMQHNPHETRHTFITKAKANNMDEHILKLIVGHQTDDITEKVYTHRTIEQLHLEMAKIQK